MMAWQRLTGCLDARPLEYHIYDDLCSRCAISNSFHHAFQDATPFQIENDENSESEFVYEISICF